MWPSRQFIVCILLCLSLFSSEAKAQRTEETIRLSWSSIEQVYKRQGQSSAIPSFTGAIIDPEKGIPYYRLQIPGAAVRNFSLISPVYQPFTNAEQKQLDGYKFKTDPEVHINNANQNKVPVSIVTILPVRRNPQTQQLEKLVQFSYTTTSGTAVTQSIARASGDFSPNSVLSTGNWYKLGVTKSGIYKIDKAALQALGIDANNIDPKKLQLFGNGGGMLPQENSAPRPDDLQENAVWVAGETDGKFNDTDYILFYAKGPHTWQYNEQEKLFKHTYNVYSDTAYYFLRVGYETGARVTNRAQAAGATQTLTAFNEHLFHERDLENMVHSGREWYGEDFSSFTLSRNIAIPAKDIVPGSELYLTSFLLGNASSKTAFQVKLNNQSLGTQTIPGRGSGDYHPQGINNSKTYTIDQKVLGSTSDLTATITYDLSGNSTAIGYLNYLELNYQRQLKFAADQLQFRSVASLNSPVSSYLVSNTPSEAMVWDVTDALKPLVQQADISGSVRFSAPSSTLREFVVFTPATTYSPVTLGKVTNQNLHSLNSGGEIDFVIVTHPKFLQQANKLAEHRRNHSGFNTVVVTVNQIYNEFSSGAQDVTAIRDFMRMLYKRSPKQGDDVMYLLLFGDASYDYKDRLISNTNFVPVYESRESLHPIESYSSEDYYGFLDDNEGLWAEDNLGDHLLDIGIGRLPAKSSSEASILVDKIISYDSPAHLGRWRNKVTLVADDSDGNEHLEDAEFLANYLEEHAPNYTTNKIYLDLFRQEAAANGQRAPEANRALDNAVEQGSLLVNFTGHGNEVSWTAEQILTLPQINAWKNKDNLTFMLTATCEFGRYDDPARTSAAEVAMLHEQGGAIGLVTTTRPVFSSGNRVLNTNFFESAFTPANGQQMPRLGDLIRQTKNNSIIDNRGGSRGVNNRNFTLLSDPSMQLAYPNLDAAITHINNSPVNTDTLSALGKYTLKGQVKTAAGGVASDFNGEVFLTVYEKQNTSSTYGDEKTTPATIKLRDNILYDGKATVTKGLFTSTFVVPKDILYKFGPGKISFYAKSSTQDAFGSNTQVTIGGTATNTATDNTPPTVHVFMNDESFVDGGNTNKNPVLLVKLHDENGINTAGIGIGHELTAVLDEQQDDLIVLNDYYTSEADNYQAGTIKYNLKDLSPGAHSVRIKAWDTYNNATEEYIEFFVSNDAELALEHVLNYPNPFSTKTTFHFDHNRAGEDLDIQIQIFTVSGKLVKTLETNTFSAQSHLAALSWNGRDEYNDLLARGVYIYKVNVRSRQDGSKATKFEKLVILN